MDPSHPPPEGKQSPETSPPGATDTPPAHNLPTDDPVGQLIYEYFQRRHAGERLTPQRFAAEHPTLADQLEPYLDGLSLLSGMGSHEGTVGAEEPAGSGETEMPAFEGYELLEELGRGGMGVAYKALQISTKRIVALKVMLAGPFASPMARRRFEREVELAARLRHPNIVQVFESGRVAQQQYYSMDYVQGTPLARYIAECDPDVATLLGIFQSICAALDYAHQHGVIHRDLKPGNVLVDAQGQPHVLDFGLAKAADPADAKATISTDISRPGQIMGTLPYLSPEQAAGRSDEVDARTDVYSLGVMIYEALTGEMPYDTSSHPSHVIDSIVEDAPTAPSSVSNRVDRELETILLKSLEKERERRYQSTADMAEDIRRYLEGEPILARRPSSLYILRKKLRKHRTPAGIVAMIIVLTAVGIIATIWQRHLDLADARLEALELQRKLEARLSEDSEDSGDIDVGRFLPLARDLYARHPSLPEARLVCAQAQYRNEPMRRDSRQFLENALQHDPSRWECRALLAEIYQDRGEVDRAEQLRAEVQRQAPDTADAWYLRSFATLDQKKALRCAEEAIRRAASHYLAWHRLTYLRFITGDLDGAIEGADRVIELGEDRAMWTLFKARALAEQGKFHEAIDQYTEVIALTSGAGSGYKERADAYRRVGDYERAVADYTESLDTQDDTRAVAWRLYQRATPLRILGREDEALADYIRIRDLLRRPSDSDARAFLILSREGRRQEAEDILQAALDEVEKPWLGTKFQCLAGRITPQELVDRAPVTDDRKAPNNRLCEAYYYAGEMCLLSGQPDDARRFFEACVGLVRDAGLDTRVGTPIDECELAQWHLDSLSSGSEGGAPSGGGY